MSAFGGGSVFSVAKAVITLDVSGVVSGASTAVGALQSVTSASGQMANNTNRSLRSMSEEAVGITRGLGAISAVAAGIGGGIAVGLGKAAQEFIGFNEVIQNIASLGDDAKASIGSLTPKIFDLATELGKSPTELADALYTVASAGFSTQDSLKIIDASARAAVAGLTEVGTASEIISAILLSYGRSADDAANVSNVLFATVQVGRVRFEELARSLGLVTPTARVLGVSIEELGAAMAALTNQGLSSRNASNQLNSLFQSLIKPNAALADALRMNGFESGQALIAAKGLGGAMQFLSQVTGDNANSMSKLLSNQRAARAAFLLTGDGAKEYARDLQATQGAQEGIGATQKSLNEQMKSTAFQIAQAKAAFQVFLDVVGAKLAPAINTGAHLLAALAKAATAVFDALDKIGLATPLVMFAGLVAGVMLGIAAFGSFAIVLIRVIEAMNAYAAAAQRATMANASLATSTAFVVNTANPVSVRLAQITGNMAASSTQSAATVSRSAATVGRAWGALRALGPIALVLTMTIPPLLKEVKSGGKSPFDSLALTLQDGLNYAVEKATGSDVIGRIHDKMDAALTGQDFVIKLGLDLDLGKFHEKTGNNAGAAEVTALGMTIDQLTEAAKKNNQTFEEYVLTQLKSKNITSEQIKLAEQQLDNAGKTQEQIDAENQALQQQQAEYEDLTSIIDTLGKVKTKADEAFDQAKSDARLTLPLTATADQFKAFAGEYNQLISDVKAKLGVVTSVADPLSFLTSQIDRTATTVSGLFLRMHDLGFGIDFTPAQQQALKLNAAMEDVDNHLKAVGDAIAQNNTDISMWKERISLVDSVLGDGTDTLAEYNAQLANGEITQKSYNKAVEDGSAHLANANLIALKEKYKLSDKEYNDILEAGIHIRERSKGAIEDEQLAQARLLPELDKWITAHDRADGAINKLSGSQKAFLSVLNESNTKQALATVQMVSYLASIGQVPPEAVTKVVADFADADPKLHALFDELGLLQDPATITVKANIDEATQKLHDITVAKDALIAKAATLRVEMAADPENQKLKDELAATDKAITELDGKQAKVSTAIKSGDAEQVKSVLAEIKGEVADINNQPVAPGSTAPPTEKPPATESEHVVKTVEAEPGSGAAPEDVLKSIDAKIAALKPTIPLAVSVADAEAQIAAIDAKIEASKNQAVIDGQLMDRTTEAGRAAYEKWLNEQKAKKLELQAEISQPAKLALAQSMQQQLDELTASRDRLAAAIAAQAANPGVLNDLAQARTLVQSRVDALMQVARPSSAQLQEMQGLKAQLQEIDHLLALPKELRVDTKGADLVEPLLRRIAAELGIVADPRDITLTTGAAQAKLDDLQTKVVGLNKSILDVTDAANAGDAKALSDLRDFTQQRDEALFQKAVLTVTLDTSQAEAQANALDTAIKQAVEQRQALSLAAGADPNNKALTQQLLISDESVQRLSALREIMLALATGDESKGFTLLQQRYLAAQAAIEANPLFKSLRPDQWTTEMQDLGAQYEALKKLVGSGDQTAFDAAFKSALQIQTSFLGSPEEIAAAQAAFQGKDLPPINAPIKATAEQQSLIDAINKIKAGAAGMNAEGKVEVKTDGLREAQKILHDLHGETLSLKDFQEIDFNINGEHTSAFINYLNEVHDKLGETFGPKYTAFLDANADGVIDNTDLAKKGLEDIAKRWTAFISADSTTFDDTVTFIEQRLADLGNPELAGGGHGIDITANADEALAVIKGLNTKIADSKLNGKLLTELDANADGFLDAVELARVTGKNLADQDFVASLEVTTKGDDEAKAKLAEVKGVAVDLTNNPGVVQITAKSDADVAKFLDQNAKELEGKRVQVSIVNDDGSIKSIEDYQFHDKHLVVTVQDQEYQTFLNSTIQLDQDGVTLDIIADDRDAAQKLLDLNAKELKGKTVSIYVKDEATGQLELVENKKLEDKDFKVNVDTSAVDNLGNETKDKGSTVDIGANTKPATDAAAKVPGEVQSEIDKQPKPTVNIASNFIAGPDTPGANAGDPSAGMSQTAQNAATAAQALVTQVLAALAALPGQMEVSGQQAGSAYNRGLGATMQAAATSASLGVVPLLNYIDGIAGAAYNPGFNLGWNFDYGIAGGIASGASMISSAAYYAAMVAYTAAAGALGIHSPSLKGREIGGFFSIGVALGVASEEERAGRAARKVAERMAEEFSSVEAKPMTFTSALARANEVVPAQDLNRLRLSSPGAGQAAVANAGGQVNNVSITVPGAGDPEAVGAVVYRRFVEAADRLRTAASVQNG